MRLQTKRAAAPSAARRWTAAALAAVVLGLGAADANAAWIDAGALPPPGPSPREFRPATESAPAIQPTAVVVLRRTFSPSYELVPSGPPLRLARELLHEAAADALPGSRLDFCAEFTKPDSLRMELMGTPKNHRSPPA